jgi:hypothetical protein
MFGYYNGGVSKHIKKQNTKLMFFTSVKAAMSVIL